MSNSRSYTTALICDSLGAVDGNPGAVSLATLHSKVLPDGCLAYVIPNKRFYVLDKTLDTPAPGDLSGGALGALGGGVWVPMLSLGSSALAVSARNLLARTIEMEGLSTFLEMPSDTNAFESVYDNSGWAVSTSSGQLTYSGQSQPFFYSISGSFIMSADNPIEMIMALRVDGDVLDQRVSVTTPDGEGIYTMTLSGIAPLIEETNVVDVVFSGDDSGESAPSLSVERINYSLIPCF